MVGATMERLGSGPTIQDIMRLLFWTRTATTSKLFITERPRGAPPPSKSRFEPGEAVLALGGRSPPSEEVIADGLLLDAFFHVTDRLIFVGGDMLVFLGIILAGLFHLLGVGGGIPDQRVI